jgi:hypothetical protein
MSRAALGSEIWLAYQRRVMQNRLAEFGLRVPLNSIASDGRPVLTREHEGNLMAEWGPRALLGYYAPGVELGETP